MSPGALPELQTPSLGVLSVVAHITDNPLIWSFGTHSGEDRMMALFSTRMTKSPTFSPSFSPEAAVVFPLRRHNYHGNVIHLSFGLCVCVFVYA